jgi:hypothetical protein
LVASFGLAQQQSNNKSGTGKTTQKSGKAGESPGAVVCIHARYFSPGLGNSGKLLFFDNSRRPIPSCLKLKSLAVTEVKGDLPVFHRLYGDGFLFLFFNF